MKRLLARAVGLLCCVLVTSALRAEDVVDYVNPKTGKVESVRGKITEEGPGGIKIRKGNELLQISALDIKQITYQTKDALGFRAGFGKETRAMQATRLSERKALLQEALSAFQNVLPDLKDNPAAERYVRFKIALVKLELAQIEPGNSTELKAALEGLTQFKVANPTGWQIVPALMKLARMQEEQGNVEAARDTYQELVDNPGASRELKRRSELQVAQLFIRAKRYSDAEAKLTNLLKDTAADDSQRGLLQLYLVESRLAQDKLDKVESDLKEALASSEDVRLKAVAHNLLGDYFRARKKDEDAVWQYLMVDALYSQDKEEHAKALYYLSKLFDVIPGNRFRAQQCLERLTDKSFAGNEYQRKAMTEKR